MKREKEFCIIDDNGQLQLRDSQQPQGKPLQRAKSSLFYSVDYYTGCPILTPIPLLKELCQQNTVTRYSLCQLPAQQGCTPLHSTGVNPPSDRLTHWSNIISSGPTIPPSGTSTLYPSLRWGNLNSGLICTPHVFLRQPCRFTNQGAEQQQL